MSGYNKSQQYAYDAEATRSNQLPGYSGIAQPSFASQYTEAPSRLTHEPSSADMPYIPSSTYESRAAGEQHSESSFIDARSRHSVSHTAPETEISEYVTPTQGTAGSRVSLAIRTNYDPVAAQHTFILMFGVRKCVARLQKVQFEDAWFNYVLNTEVPKFADTNEWNPTMTVKLQIEDKHGELRSQSDAGKFTFTDMSPNLTYQSPPDYSRKRKYSTEYGDAQDYTDDTATKRIQSSRFQAKPRARTGAYSTAQVSPLPVQSSLAGAYGGGYDMAKQASYSSDLSQKGLYAVPSGMSLSQSDFKLPETPTHQSYGLYNSIASTGRNSGSISTTPHSASMLPSPAVLQTPVLIRSTTLPQTASSSSSQSFNPYSMYQTKAVLKIDGDLDKMSDEWTQGELDAKRRLVEFKRSQHGSTITTSFAPITPEARPARSICVSCIWWEEKDECFITSVDTIYLLEQLVNVRFTVEEKNRIRRNLEGFRPLTVSKAKADSEEFFKVIMAFPNPKPRNIEKDVKVFPWKILAHALKKIISKYSASYSSTAGAGSLPTTSTPGYPSSAMSYATVGAHRNSSPQSVSASTVSAAYTPHMATSSLSPHLKGSAGLDVSAGHGLPRTPSGHSMTQWTPPSHHMQYPGGRGSWDYAYMNTSAAAGIPSVATQLQHRSDLATDVSQMSADNSYPHYYGDRTTRV